MDEPARDPESGPAPMSLRRTLGMAAGGPGSSRLAAWRRRGAWPAALSLAAVALLGGYQGISGAMGSQGVSTPILPSPPAATTTADAALPTPSAATPAGATDPGSLPGSEPTPAQTQPPAAGPSDDHGGRDDSRGGGSGGEDHSGSGHGGDEDNSGHGPGGG